MINLAPRSAGPKGAASLGLSILLLLGGCFRSAARADPSSLGEKSRAPAAEAEIRRWPPAARAAAGAMIAEYGPPDRAAWSELRWTGNGPWAKTIAHRSAWPEVFGHRKQDYLEQTVDYRVPEDKAPDLKRFDDRIELNLRDGQMSARSPDEPTNILLLNLASEIASGRRDVASARAFAARALELAKSGKSSAYMVRLLFPPNAK